MKNLCQKIHMPEEAAQVVLKIHQDPDFSPELSGLFREETWIDALTQLQVALGEDPDGYRGLCCMLRCALEAKAEYDRLGLSEEIYRDTMACFSRFVREHFESFGRFGFDRGFWTVRQISCKLFRIGALEYELTTWQGRKAVSLHIPSDITLQLPLLRKSWEDARACIAATFPEYRDAPMFCKSWLLGPTLKELLPETSGILRFQRSFRLTEQHPNDESYVSWVFKNPQLSPEDYPEKTSLQRALKAHLLSGGTFTAGEGVLMDDPFL